MCVYIYIYIHLHTYELVRPALARTGDARVHSEFGMLCLRMWCLIIIGFTKTNNIIYHNIW